MVAGRRDVGEAEGHARELRAAIPSATVVHAIRGNRHHIHRRENRKPRPSSRSDGTLASRAAARALCAWLPKEPPRCKRYEETGITSTVVRIGSRVAWRGETG